MEKDRIDEIIQASEQRENVKENDINIVKDFLIIEIASVFLAIQIEYLREVFDVLDRKDIATIPFTPPYIRGIINIRGEIIPVLLLSTIIGHECNDDENLKMVIIEHNKLKVGFPFFRIVDLKTIKVKELKMIKDIKRKVDNAFISEEFEAGDMNVGILDIPKLYSSEFFT